MESLIIVGGLQHSGKSTLARRLKELDGELYRHIELDYALEYLNANRSGFIRYIRRLNPGLYAEIRKLGDWLGEQSPELKPKSDADYFIIFANYMRAEKRIPELEDVIDGCCLHYSSERLLEAQDGIPVVDGTLLNRVSRQYAYSAFKNAVAQATNLDDIGKLIVYFNLGLKTSLRRYKEKKREEKEEFVLSKKSIKADYRGQEVPKSGEFPNTEVLVITRPDEVDDAVKYIAKEYH